MDLRNSSTIDNVLNGAVATDDRSCSRIGLEVLREGGNAADASIASALCLGVTNPASSGLGGGAFILVHSDASMAREADRSRRRSRSLSTDDGKDDDDDDVPFIDERARWDDDIDIEDGGGGGNGGRWGRKVAEFIDCRETAPRNTVPETYDSPLRSPESSTIGGMAIAVPGELRGLELLHRRHGSMPWSRLVRPAYELAREGVVVGRYLASAIGRNAMHLRTMPELGKMLTKDGDDTTPLEEGDVMVRARYAETLKSIMENGANALYRGELAESLARVSVGPVARWHE
jgi:gamma-glutamyltranspeptidase